MLSPIASESAPPSSEAQPQVTDNNDNGPKSIPTPATQWAPKGRIIDDSARGTIFWEVNNSELDDGVNAIGPQQQAQEEKAAPRQSTLKPTSTLSPSSASQEWGKPFKIEWISTTRLPFYRTRGLRNPWNDNREIKIARDGTEIEPSIGQRLVQMFHRPQPLPQNVRSMPVGLPSNFSPMAPYFPL
jgi:hypothetical protein